MICTGKIMSMGIVVALGSKVRKAYRNTTFMIHQVQGISIALINDTVIYELKRYLAETDLTVEEIAARMNYDNVSYLCRFFRNATGQSMMEFRRKQR